MLMFAAAGLFAAATAAAFHVVTGIPEVSAVDILVVVGVPSLVGVLDVDSLIASLLFLDCTL